MPKTVSHPPTPQVDMSAEAIDQRLRDLAQLYRLGMSLRDVKLVGKTVALRRKATGDSPRANEDSQRSTHK